MAMSEDDCARYHVDSFEPFNKEGYLVARVDEQALFLAGRNDVGIRMQRSYNYPLNHGTLKVIIPDRPSKELWNSSC